MLSSQPQRRRLHVILDELEEKIVQQDDVGSMDLQRLKEHLSRILEVIHMRCGQRQEVSTATEPVSARDAAPTTKPVPFSNNAADDPESGPARRDSGISRGPSQHQHADTCKLTAEPQSNSAWVDAMIDSLEQKRDQIEDYAELSLDEQLNFDWEQDDVRITHCLTGVPKGSESHLRSLAARSLAIEYERWSCARTISEQTARKVAKNGAIPAFVDTLKVKQEDKKQVTTVIGAGRKMLLLERAFGCSAISAVVAFVWRSFYRARNENITQLGLKLQHCWLSQYAKENQSRFGEVIRFYEEKQLGRKRRFQRSSQEASAVYKRARLDDVSGVGACETQAAPLSPTGVQSSQMADYLGTTANGRSSGGAQEMSGQTANNAILAPVPIHSFDSHAGNCQLGMLADAPAPDQRWQASSRGAAPARQEMQWNNLSGEIEASVMPAPDPRWQFATTGAAPARQEMQWNNLSGEIEASMMSAPGAPCWQPLDPRWQCSVTETTPVLSNDDEWSTSETVGREMPALTLSNNQWHLLSDELELSIMPGPGIFGSELSGFAAVSTTSSA